MTSPADQNEQPAVPPNNNTNHGRHKALLFFTLFLIIVAIIWFCLWFFYFQYHESTDDAYANGNMININPTVPGSVITIFADDTDLVTEGQLLVQLDPTNYRVIYEKELETLTAIILQIKQLYNTVQVNMAGLENKRAVLERAAYDYQNRLDLVNTKAISNEDFTHAKDDFLVAQFNVRQAEYQLKVSQDAIGNTSIEKHPLIEKQKGIVREAYYNLQHCNILAPATGYIAQRMVNVGEWVSQNIALMAVIPVDYVWVDANFKETQLTYMRIGQHATVWFDLYGSRVKYTGKVLGIASGSGSVFSLIPPQNATGNWIKIVQRLPVRISLDAETVKKFPIRLGLSAEVNVDIAQQDLPMLAQTPSKKPILTTKVFDIDMEKVNRTMDELILKTINANDIIKKDFKDDMDNSSS